MKIKYYSLFLICTTLLYACIRTEDVESTANKISVNCLFSSDSCWTAHVFYPDKKHELDLYIRDETDSLIQLNWDEQKGSFMSETSKPKAGVIYSLEVLENDKKKIISQSLIPEYADIRNVTALSEKEQIRIEFELNFQQEIPFYLFRIEQMIEGNRLSFSINEGSSIFEYINDRNNRVLPYVILKNDKQKEKMHLFISIQSSRVSLKEPIILSVESCSQDAGMYWASMQGYTLGHVSLIYSNIKGQLGIFGGYNTMRYPAAIRAKPY